MASPFCRVDIIYNPNSTNDAPSKATWLGAELGKTLFGIPIVLHQTKRSGHAVDIAANLTKKHGNSLLVSVSGDGGYHEVINGALSVSPKSGPQPICAVYPAGNANDHRHATKEQSLVKAIAEGIVSTIDVLQITITDKHGKQVNKLYGHSYAGLGITPKVAAELNKHELNSLLEKFLVIKTFLSFKPFSIEHDGIVKDYDSLIFANIPRMAKVLELSDNSQQDDGQFEVVAQLHRGKLALVTHGFKAALFGLKAQPKSRQFVFSLPNKIDMQIDGEIITPPSMSKIKITIKRGIRTIL